MPTRISCVCIDAVDPSSRSRLVGRPSTDGTWSKTVTRSAWPRRAEACPLLSPSPWVKKIKNRLLRADRTSAGGQRRGVYTGKSAPRYFVDRRAPDK